MAGVRFKIDENLPTELAELLRSRGHDAATVREQRMSGTPDATLGAVCAQERRTVVTLDRGFAWHNTQAGAATAGVVVLRLLDQSKPSVLSAMQRALDTLTNEQLGGRIIVVSESGVRLRTRPNQS